MPPWEGWFPNTEIGMGKTQKVSTAVQRSGVTKRLSYLQEECGCVYWGMKKPQGVLMGS